MRCVRAVVCGVDCEWELSDAECSFFSSALDRPVCWLSLRTVFLFFVHPRSRLSWRCDSVPNSRFAKGYPTSRCGTGTCRQQAPWRSSPEPVMCESSEQADG